MAPGLPMTAIIAVVVTVGATGIGFAVMIVVSLMTRAPSKEMQDFIDELRVPRGKTLMEEKTA